MLKTPRRIWVIGGTGLLGKPLVRRLIERGFQVRADGCETCDVRDAAQVNAVIREYQPLCIINCAARTNVDACETNETEAMAVNAVGAGIVAAAARLANARLVQISTDYVFSGSTFSGDASPLTAGLTTQQQKPYQESDATGPASALCVYGRSKLAGEEAVRREYAEALIVRTAWLYGHDGPGFPQAILKQARAGAALRVVNDQTGAPTYAEDLADAVVRLIEVEADPSHRSGATDRIVHVTNSGMCTWYEFAKELVRLAELNSSIEPINSAQSGRAAQRPSWSVLDCSRYGRLTGHTMRDWRDATAAFIHSSHRK